MSDSNKDIEKGQIPSSGDSKEKNLLLRQASTIVRGREAKESTGTIGQYIAGCVGCCCTLITTLLIICIVDGLFIISIVIGSIYIDESNCPADTNIAPCLIASGVIGIILSIFESRTRVSVAKKSNGINQDGSGDNTNVEAKKDICYWILNIIRIMNFILFIYMCIIVFQIYSNVVFEPYEPGTLPNADNINYYCHPTLYLFTFWLLLLTFIIVGIAIGCGCFCLGCCLTIAAAS